MHHQITGWAFAYQRSSNCPWRQVSAASFFAGVLLVPWSATDEMMDSSTQSTTRALACGFVAGAAGALTLRALLLRTPRKGQQQQQSGRDDDNPRLTPYVYSADFPPRSIGADPSKASEWYAEVFAAVPMKYHDATLWTARENGLLFLTAEEYVGERRAGRVTCEEFVRLLVRRVHLYRYMNQWVYTTYGRLQKAIEAARRLDERATEDGIESIAPLYGLPVPMKGTGAVVDYPSGAGVGVLSGYTPLKNCAMVERLEAAHAVVFGATNVPEFAASINTCNAASG